MIGEPKYRTKILRHHSPSLDIDPQQDFFLFPDLLLFLLWPQQKLLEDKGMDPNWRGPPVGRKVAPPIPSFPPFSGFNCH